MKNVCIEPATQADLPAIEQLLRAAGLPREGVRDQFPHAFVVARAGDTLIGAAALERYAGAALLRSVVVAPSFARRGVGRALTLDRLHAAAGAPVYLLTETARPYFESLGFTPADRAAVPSALAASPEFASACPASAACLVHRAA